MIRAGHRWPCPASVGHTTCTCSKPERALATTAQAAQELHDAMVDLFVAIKDALRLEWVVAFLAAFLVQPGRHRGERRQVSLEAGLASVALVELIGFLVLVGVLS